MGLVQCNKKQLCHSMTSETIHLASCRELRSGQSIDVTLHDRIVTSTVKHVYTSSAAHLFGKWHKCS
jgi:hypothetical protein